MLKILSAIFALTLSTAALAQAPNPFKPGGGAPGASVSGQPRGAAQPGALPPPIPSNNGMPPPIFNNGGDPNMTGMPPAMPPAPNVVELDVSVTRVGKVNGLSIFRGQNVYLFEKENKPRVVRKPQLANSGSSNFNPVTNGMPAQGTPPNLPSMVGRPAP